MKQVWCDIELHLDVDHLWDKDSLEDCYHGVSTNRQLKWFRALPILVVWGIWLARNANLFKDSHTPTFKVSQQVLTSLPLYKPTLKQSRNV